MRVRRVENLVVCPNCKGKLIKNGKQLICNNCKDSFMIEDEKILFTHQKGKFKKKGFFYSFKEKIKVNKLLFAITNIIFSPIFPNISYKKYLLPKGNTILDIGSGPYKLREDIINIDMKNYPGVNIICDAKRLPFNENSVDQIFNFSLLEHTEDPQKIIDEMYRVLKPSGTLYTLIPFLQPYHPTPCDYWRFSKEGVIKLHSDFEKIKCGVYAGPISTLLWIMQEFLAMTLSLGIPFLKDFWLLVITFLTFPVKILDPIFRLLPSSHILASAFYFYGKKTKGN
ncbi:methyltransferase domain-containing protein [bacterium]|nr:methyltransferase domain-containing protein [bacterium]